MIVPAFLAACAHAQSPNSQSDAPAKQDAQVAEFNILVNEARLRKLGIEPGSDKATIAMMYMSREQADPDIQRMFVSIRSHKLDPANPVIGKAINADGLLRLTPADRDVFLQKALFISQNEVPADCDGLTPAVAMVKHNTYAHAPVELVEQSMSLDYRAMKAAATGTTPLATLTPEQRTQTVAAIGKQVISDVHGDQEATQKLANYLADQAGANAELRCWATKRSFAGLVHMSEPLRDQAAIYMLSSAQLPGISAILSGSAAATDAPQKSQEPMSSPAAAETQRRHELARHL